GTKDILDFRHAAGSCQRAPPAADGPTRLYLRPSGRCVGGTVAPPLGKVMPMPGRRRGRRQRPRPEVSCRRRSSGGLTLHAMPTLAPLRPPPPGPPLQLGGGGVSERALH